MLHELTDKEMDVIFIFQSVHVNENLKDSVLEWTSELLQNLL